MEELDSDMKELLVLRDFFQRTGLLHEAQVEQLNLWSSGILCASEATVNLDFSEPILIFKILKFHDKKFLGLFTLKDRKPKDFRERVSYVKKCVKFLLGSHVKVRVDVKDKESY